MSAELRYTKLPLNTGVGKIPALGFGTLIPGATATAMAVEAALEAGFRHLDCAERYRNEDAVGDALSRALAGARGNGRDAPKTAVRQTATEPQALQREPQTRYSISIAMCANRNAFPCSVLHALGKQPFADTLAIKPTARDHAAMRRFRRKARSPPVYFEFIQLIDDLWRIIFASVCI
jgi:hypothetical protein